MAKPTKPVKPPVAKGPVGLHSLTVLFFPGQLSFLGEEANAQAAMMGLRSITARYVEVLPDQWELRVKLRTPHSTYTKLSFQLSKESDRTSSVLQKTLKREIDLQYRLYRQRLERPVRLPVSTAASA